MKKKTRKKDSVRSILEKMQKTIDSLPKTLASAPTSQFTTGPSNATTAPGNHKPVKTLNLRNVEDPLPVANKRVVGVSKMSQNKELRHDSMDSVPMELKKQIVDHYRNDVWSNVATNLGMWGRDKRMMSRPNPLGLGITELDTLYQSDDTAARLVDRIPEEMFREGYDILLDGVNEEDDSVQELQTLIDSHHGNQKQTWGWKLGKLYGGAGIFVGVNDGLPPWMPLEMDKIRSVDYLTVLDRYELVSAGIIDRDVRSANFARPEWYRLSTIDPNMNTLRIHHSRIIRFEGCPMPRRLAAYFDYWGQSIFNRIWEIIMNFQQSNSSVAAILADFNKIIFKMDSDDMNTIFAQGNAESLAGRFELVNYLSSILNAIVIRPSEEVTQITRQVTGLSDLMERICDRLVAATDIPRIVLLGKPTTGLGDSGQSEMRMFYDYIKNQQKARAEPAIRKMIEIFMAAKTGPFNGKIKKFTIDWKPLWQMDEGAQTTMRYQQAQTDQIYFGMGLDSEEIIQSRFGQGYWSPVTNLDNKIRAKLKAAPKKDPEDPEGGNDIENKTPDGKSEDITNPNLPKSSEPEATVGGGINQISASNGQDQPRSLQPEQKQVW